MERFVLKNVKTQFILFSFRWFRNRKPWQITPYLASSLAGRSLSFLSGDVSRAQWTSEQSHRLSYSIPFRNAFLLLYCFSSRCTYNCYPRVAINEKTTFEANCSGLTCKSITRYQWALYQIDQQSPDPLWIPIKNIAAKAIFDGLNFVLRGKINATEYSLELNTTYKAELFAFIDERQVAKGEIQITTNSPPVTYYGGGCLISPSEGLALQTNFLVNCSQWYDEDLPLSYTFR